MATETLFRDVVILGGGPAGLAAGHVLTAAGTQLIVVEANAKVGGLARTIKHRGFRFDLGGHRFLTSNKNLERLVRGVLMDKILRVSRSSKILLDNKFYDYPIDLRNALVGLGFAASLRIIFDYLSEQAKSVFQRVQPVSLEDWIVRQFGRTLFDIFFKGYSAKVWGIGCDRIAMEWGAQRIQGLSLSKAIKDALVPSRDERITTLARSFLYPLYGFGEISEGLKRGIEEDNEVLTNARVIAVHHAEGKIQSVTMQCGDIRRSYKANEFVCSIPITAVLGLLDPPAPAAIVDAASKLKFRDLVVVSVMLDRESVTDQTWIYIPDSSVPFGRIHEPKNWSPEMAPPGKTHLVTEFFCTRDDDIWNKSDAELTELTAHHLQKLGFIDADEVVDSVVMRIGKAYPIFEINYMKYYERVCDHLESFSNLHLIGRTGRFRYFNTDSAMESGIAAAESIIARGRQPGRDDPGSLPAAISA